MQYIFLLTRKGNYQNKLRLFCIKTNSTHPKKDLYHQLLEPLEHYNSDDKLLLGSKY